MKYNRMLKKSIIFPLVLILIVITGGTVVFASDTSNVMPSLPGEPYSLTITMQSSNPDGSETPITGAEVSVYQVADLKVKYGGAYYTLKPGFEDTGISFENMTAEESQDAARLFAETAENEKIAGVSRVSDKNGVIRFTDLKPGAYLVRLDRYGDHDAGYTAMDPFLVLVPGIEKQPSGNRWISHVRVVPKVAVNPKDTCTVAYSVVKNVKGNPSADETFVFELQAEDIMNPMPVGSTDGTKRVSRAGAGTVGLGAWTYTEPGSYRYTVREIAGNNKRYTYDKTVYHMTDRVYYKGNHLKVDHRVTDQNGKTVTTESFLFTNQYRKPGFGPKTGDEIRMMIWLICMIAGTCGIVVSIKRRGCRR